MTKKERFINTIFMQLNIKLKNDKDNQFNKKRDWLYTEVKESDKTVLLSYLKKHSVEYNEHYDNYYWIKV